MCTHGMLGSEEPPATTILPRSGSANPDEAARLALGYDNIPSPPGQLYAQPEAVPFLDIISAYIGLSTILTIKSRKVSLWYL